MNTPFYFNDVFDTNILSDLHGAEGPVYMAYLRYSNGGRDIAYPSQAHLAWSLGVSERTIGRAVKVLQQKRFILQVSSGKGGQSTKASEYTVKTPAQLGYFSKKNATQAPVPPAPVPTPAKQAKPRPAPAVAPAPTPATDSQQIMRHKTPQGITAVEVYNLAKKKGYSKVAAFENAKDFDEYIYLVGNLEIEIGNEKLEKFWQEVNAA